VKTGQSENHQQSPEWGVKTGCWGYGLEKNGDERGNTRFLSGFNVERGGGSKRGSDSHQNPKKPNNKKPTNQTGRMLLTNNTKKKHTQVGGAPPALAENHQPKTKNARRKQRETS